MSKPPLNSRRFKQGYFEPYYKDKYVGDVRNIKYRSGWERKVMEICDQSNEVKKWSSEPIKIPYYSPIDNRLHRYYVDFWIEFENGNKLLVEIKPFSQTKKPIYLNSDKPNKTKRLNNYIYEMKQYAINLAKWRAAELLCQKMPNWKFVVWTENDLKLND